MTKIYNEISIDMNPESSSYGETLHEDSFEHEGPMMKMWHKAGVYPGTPEWDYYHPEGDLQESDTTAEFTGQTIDPGTGTDTSIMTGTEGYQDHTQFSEYGNWYLMERAKPGGGVEWYILDENQNTQETHDGATTSKETAVNRLKDLWGGMQSGVTQEVAPDIDYSDFSQFIDESGAITDKQGMVDYLQTVGMEDKLPGEIMGLLSNMPNLSVSRGELGQAKSKYQSDVYGLQSQLKGARQKEQSMAGMTGIYSPTAKGFGGESFAQGLYSQLGELQAGAQDQYGLGEEKEQDLATWIASMTGVA
jgi:hypothetical protein